MLLGGRVLWLLNDVIRDIHFSFFLSFLPISIHMHIFLIIIMSGRALACVYINFADFLSMLEIIRQSAQYGAQSNFLLNK